MDNPASTFSSSPSQAPGRYSHVHVIVTPAAAPGTFNAHIESGETIVNASRQPLADAARALLACGYPADQLLTMRHAGAACDSFVPTSIGWWARWNYEESDRDGLRRRRWMPRQLQEEGQKSGAEAPTARMTHPEAEFAPAGRGGSFKVGRPAGTS